MAAISRRYFQVHFRDKKFCILIKILLKFVPKGPIDNISALVEIMAWRQIGAKILSQPMLTRFTVAYTCSTRGRWVNSSWPSYAMWLQRSGSSQSSTKPLPESMLTYHKGGLWHSLDNNLTHWTRNKLYTISQTTFSNAFSWMKTNEFRLRFHWTLFLRVQLTMFQHWFR